MNIEIKDNIEVTKPPIASIGIIGWLRKNLFSSLASFVFKYKALFNFYKGILAMRVQAVHKTFFKKINLALEIA